MNLEDMKKEAAQHKLEDSRSLSLKISELKKQGASFLRCVAFVQLNQGVSLKEARELTVALDACTKE